MGDETGQDHEGCHPNGRRREGQVPVQIPVEAELWEAWQKFSKDPEKHIADWARFGAPLGMGARIPRSNGVFPPIDDDSRCAMT